MGSWLDDVKPEYRAHAQLGADVLSHCRMAAALASEGNGEVYDIFVDLLVAANDVVLLLSDKEISAPHQHYVISAEARARQALARLEALNRSISEVPGD